MSKIAKSKCGPYGISESSFIMCNEFLTLYMFGNGVCMDISRTGFLAILHGGAFLQFITGRNGGIWFMYFYGATYVRLGRVHVNVFPLVVCSYCVCAIVDGVSDYSLVFLRIIFFGSCKFVIVRDVLDFVLVLLIH